jgi:hypothetical protein
VVSVATAQVAVAEGTPELPTRLSATLYGASTLNPAGGAIAASNPPLVDTTATRTAVVHCNTMLKSCVKPELISGMS